MSLWSDQSDSLLTECVATFGEPMKFVRGFSNPFTVNCIFGHPNQEDTEHFGTGITLDVRVADFAGSDDNPAPFEFSSDPVPRSGDVVTITTPTGGTDSYTAYQVQVDSEGCGKIYLRLTTWNS